jgi:glycosyltransferase involved in cell wall biosynthesis
MNSSTPEISIIIPCYNQAQFLNAALQSVLDQTYNNWECIIVNDGSSDHTEEVAKKWIEKDSRYIYLYKENGGLSSARNGGLDMVKGDYIQFLDSDDCIAKTKIEESLRQFNLVENEEIKVVISNFRMFVDNVINTTAPYCNLNNQFFTFESLLYQWGESFTIPIHCGLFNSSLFKDFKFPEHLKAREDWVMWVSIFHKDCKAVFIDKPLSFYRKNPDSMTMTKDMLPDLIKAVEYFRNILSPAAFNQLSVVLISRYYKKNDALKLQLHAVKKSNSYQTGLMIKKILKTLGLLNLFKRLFPVVLKFKS